MSDATLLATSIQCLAWGVAVAVWRRLDVGTAPRRIILGAYAGTALLGLSTTCHALALLLGAAPLLAALASWAGGAVVAYLVAVGLYDWRVRAVAAGPRVGPLRMETERAAAGRPAPAPPSDVIEPWSFGAVTSQSARVRSILAAEV